MKNVIYHSVLELALKFKTIIQIKRGSLNIYKYILFYCLLGVSKENWGDLIIHKTDHLLFSKWIKKIRRNLFIIYLSSVDC